MANHIKSAFHCIWLYLAKLFLFIISLCGTQEEQRGLLTDSSKNTPASTSRLQSSTATTLPSRKQNIKSCDSDTISATKNDEYNVDSEVPFDDTITSSTNTSFIVSNPKKKERSEKEKLLNFSNDSTSKRVTKSGKGLNHHHPHDDEDEFSNKDDNDITTTTTNINEDDDVNEDNDDNDDGDDDGNDGNFRRRGSEKEAEETSTKNNDVPENLLDVRKKSVTILLPEELTKPTSLSSSSSSSSVATKAKSTSPANPSVKLPYIPRLPTLSPALQFSFKDNSRASPRSSTFLPIETPRTEFKNAYAKITAKTKKITREMIQQFSSSPLSPRVKFSQSMSIPTSSRNRPVKPPIVIDQTEAKNDKLISPLWSTKSEENDVFIIEESPKSSQSPQSIDIHESAQFNFLRQWFEKYSKENISLDDDSFTMIFPIESDNPNNIQYNQKHDPSQKQKEGFEYISVSYETIKAATLEKLIEKLVFTKNRESESYCDLRDVFFGTYTSFTNPEVLLDKFASIFILYAKKDVEIAGSVIECIEYWISNYMHDLSHETICKLIKFVLCIEQTSLKVACPDINHFAKMLQDKIILHESNPKRPMGYPLAVDYELRMKEILENEDANTEDEIDNTNDKDQIISHEDINDPNVGIDKVNLHRNNEITKENTSALEGNSKGRNEKDNREDNTSEEVNEKNNEKQHNNNNSNDDDDVHNNNRKDGNRDLEGEKDDENVKEDDDDDNHNDDDNQEEDQDDEEEDDEEEDDDEDDDDDDIDPLKGEPIFPDFWKSDIKLTFNLLDWHPLEIARQITLIEQNLFKNIQSRELLNNNFSQKNMDTRAPNLAAFIHHFNAMSRWIIRCILQEQNVAKRSKIVSYAIDLLETLATLRNFNCIMAIYGALNQTVIHRLKNTWSMVPEEQIEALEMLGELLSPSQKFKNMRDMIDQMGPPCIPYLGIFLTDLSTLDAVSDTYIPVSSSENEDPKNEDVSPRKHINVNKLRVCTKVFRHIQSYQHHSYELKEVQYLQDVFKHDISNVTWSEEEEYEKSLMLEPKTTTKDPEATTSVGVE